MEQKSGSISPFVEMAPGGTWLGFAIPGPGPAPEGTEFAPVVPALFEPVSTGEVVANETVWVSI